jgi:hypothetical protein
MNGWDMTQMTPVQIVEHYKLVDHFTMNLDESCMQASASNLRIISSQSKLKHEKNTFDCRESITVVRVGSAANDDGPRFYLVKGKEIKFNSFRNFTANYNAPEGSYVLMTPSAYMTDEAWRELVPHLCRGIRSMKGVCDHPDFWVVLSLDGFGSHLDTDALLVFTEYKILVIKEEGDTSQVSQAYDQMVARADKRNFKELLDTVRAHYKTVLNQWDIIIIVNDVLNLVAKTVLG